MQIKFRFSEQFQIRIAPTVIPSQWLHWRGNLKENQQLQEIATSAAPPRNDNWLVGEQVDKSKYNTPGSLEPGVHY